MADPNVDYTKWDKINYEEGEEEKLELDYDIDSDGEPPSDQVGDIRNIIRNKNEKIVRKEIMKVGEGLSKPGKPYIVMVHAMGYTKSKFVFLPLTKNVKMTLGDLRLPSGLWKSIEHMKKGECAKIWIKPGEHGFGRSKYQDALQWPELVRDDEEKKQLMRDEEIYYEIELLDWIVRSDILGDGQLMKTFEVVADGYDRCGDDDEVVFDYKISKLDEKTNEEDLDSGTDHHYSMITKATHSHFDESKTDSSEKIGRSDISNIVLNPSLDLVNDGKFTFAMKRVLKSMKLGEKSFTVIQHSWLEKHDKEAIEKYNLSPGDRLKIDLNFKDMLHIEDFYKDGTTYKKVLQKGKGTASPLSDSLVAIKIKIAYNKMSDSEKEQLIFETKEPVDYALDEYVIPPLLRRMFRTLKLHELIEIHTVLKDELTSEFPDEKHKIFIPEHFEKVGEIDDKTGQQRWVVITMQMIAFETPEAMHGLFMEDKVPRLLRIKDLATKFFKKGDFKNACKQYQRMYSHFNLKDIYNNLNKEDENSEEYKKIHAELKKIELQSLTNTLVCKNKLEEWQDIIDFVPKALELDPENVKAHFFHGRALLHTHEYDQAMETFNKILKLNPENKEAARELARVKKEKKKYEEKCKAMFKFS